MGLPLVLDTVSIFPIPPVAIDPVMDLTTDRLLELITQSGRIALSDVKAFPGGHQFDEPRVYVGPGDNRSANRFELAHPEMMTELFDLTFARTSTDDSGDRYPYRLICRRTTSAYNSSCIDQATHRGRLYNPAFLHPEDLLDLGLLEGDRVLIQSPGGEAIAVVAVDAGLRRGLVSISHGYGSIGDDLNASLRVGVNVNRLLQLDGRFDRFSGQPLMSNVPVRLSALTTHASDGRTGRELALDPSDP